MCDHHGVDRNVTAHPPTGVHRPAGELDDRLDEAVGKLADQVVSWRHQIHRQPELSNREVKTSELVAEHFRTLDLDEVRTGIAGYGVVGVLRGGGDGGRVIALRADIDALPVKEASGEDFASSVIDEGYPGGPFPVAHACGHDCHTAMLMGAASALASVREGLPGTVLFVFQPAEEGPPLGEDGGAQAMDDAGALADPKPSMVFGVHVAPYPNDFIGYRVGNQYAASVLVRIEITGRQVHGSTPWMGVDPMPVAAEIITATGQLYRQLPAYDPFTVSIGHVEDRGRFNIIGESVTLYGTIRASIDRDMDDLQGRVKRLAEHLAAASGCQAKTASSRTSRRSTTASSGSTRACRRSSAWSAPTTLSRRRRRSATTTFRYSSTATAASTFSSAVRTRNSRTPPPADRRRPWRLVQPQPGLLRQRLGARNRCAAALARHRRSPGGCNRARNRLTATGHGGSSARRNFVFASGVFAGRAPRASARRRP